MKEFIFKFIYINNIFNINSIPIYRNKKLILIKFFLTNLFLILKVNKRLFILLKLDNAYF